MPFEMLPNLKEGPQRTLPALTTPGWNRFTWDALGKLAESLRVGAPSAQHVNIDAIPDIWAKPLLFAYALRERDHELRPEAIVSLRGFLAILALRHRKRFDISISQVDVAKKDGQEFFRAIRRIEPPPPSMAPDTTWDKHFIFKMDDQPIGMTSPLSLVYPEGGSDLHALSRVGWWNGSHYSDPISQLHELDRLLLAEWIGQLSTGLGGAPLDAKWWNPLLEILNKFQSDLRSQSPRQDIADASNIFSTDILSADFERVSHSSSFYRFLAPAISSADDETESMVELAATQPGPPRKLLILDESLPRVFNTSPADIVIYRGITYGDVRTLTLGPSRTQLGNENLTDGYAWADASDFFIEKLCLVRDTDLPVSRPIEGQQSVTTSSNYKDYTPILPISEIILDYLPGEEVARRVKYSVAGSRVTVSLALPLRGNREVTLKKIYDEDACYRFDMPPILGMWPNFRSPRWKAYYSFCSFDSVDVSGRPRRRTFSAKPYLVGASALLTEESPGDVSARDSRSRERPASRKHRQIWFMPAPPEAFVCEGSDPHHPRKIGLILASNVRGIDVTPNLVFDIGIDFGTTNTNVYIRPQGHADERPTQLQFHTRAAAVALFSALDHDLEHSRAFLPAEEVQDAPSEPLSPFLSFFRKRGSLAYAGEAIREGHILFCRNERVRIDGPGTELYLKWQRNLPEQNIQSFLVQVCLHAAAEAFQAGAKAIRWRYSLPTAFSANRQQGFERIWHNVSKRISELTGLESLGPEWRTESEAAANYFKYKDNARPGLAAMFLDIGGATTDISLWRQNRLVSQVSIRLAGREIFLRPFALIAPQLFRDHPSVTLSAAEVDGWRIPEKSFGKLDALIKLHGDTLLNFIGNTEMGLRRRLSRSVALGLSGLFYYAGLFARAHKNGDEGTDPSIDGLYFGGNGSKTFLWAGEGAFPTTPLMRMFQNSFLSALQRGGTAPAPNIVLSEHPKAEAAFGLVVDELPRSAHDLVHVVAGEAFKIGDRLSPETESLTLGAFYENDIQVEKLTNLEHFLAQYNSFAKSGDWVLPPVKHVESILDDALKDLRQHLQDQRAKSSSADVELEPLFVTGLRFALRRVAEQA